MQSPQFPDPAQNKGIESFFLNSELCQTSRSKLSVPRIFHYSHTIRLCPNIKSLLWAWAFTVVDAVLNFEDWVTKFASRGPDSGVDIFAEAGHVVLTNRFFACKESCERVSVMWRSIVRSKIRCRHSRGSRVCLLIRLQQSCSSGSQTGVLHCSPLGELWIGRGNLL